MAYINVTDWKCEQVKCWIGGLGDQFSSLEKSGSTIQEAFRGYIQSFNNNQVCGRQLLNIRPYELEQLGIYIISHQEIILEAVDHLKNFHYNLDKENLQYLAMQVTIQSTSLYKNLSYHTGKTIVETQILSDVTRTIAHIKKLILWLDRAPFQGQIQYNEIRTQMLRYGLELATSAQRDRFVENPVKQIKNSALKLSKLADYIIQDISDPMNLQPASLVLVTLKKRESELGFFIMPSYQSIHRVTDIKYNSPAHNSGKIEEGDEIVQINYQTVVGWQYKKVLQQLQESTTEVYLTLKKRPKHTKIYGQIYIKPYRLPSKKRSLPYRWDSLPSPRVELFTMPNFPLPLALVPEKSNSSDSESSGSEMLTPNDVKESQKDLRLYLPKPRAVLQRRHTISGDDLMSFKNVDNLISWHERKEKEQMVDSPSLRDKSVSFGFGLELTPRPTTCLGISSNSSTVKTSLPNINKNIAEKVKKMTALEIVPDSKGEIFEQKLKTGVSKVVRFDSNMKFDEYNHDSKYSCNVEGTIIESFLPIPYADDELVLTSPTTIEPTEDSSLSSEKFCHLNNFQINLESSKEFKENDAPARKAIKMTCDNGLVEAVNVVVINREEVRRGRYKLDKSHSTPAYDIDSDTPPAIEPRTKVPPVPPPRPKKTLDVVTMQLSPFVVSNVGSEGNDENKSKLANVIELKTKKTIEMAAVLPINQTNPEVIRKPSISKPFLEEPSVEALELLTPNKTKSLTNKKKNSLMAKRRKITLKVLGTSDIQGHLYRRSKDKSGVTYWAKCYFVLIETALYGFKAKESLKADSLVFLSGFTVSLAKEVHSKQFAFKVYHQLKTFYFAAETNEALLQWMEYIKQATMKGNNSNGSVYNTELKELFSETDCSEDESSEMNNKQLCTPSPQLVASAEKLKENSDTPTSSKHYHLNFGSLKKFARGANAAASHNGEPSPSDHKFLGFFTSNKSSEKKISQNDVPVPTSQYKSYRKVQGNVGGLQLGANSMINSSMSITDFYLQYDQQQESSQPKEETKLENIKVEKMDSELALIPERKERKKRSRKAAPHNYIHASNPNLVEFDFHSPKTSFEFPVPKLNANTWDGGAQGVLTLKALMLQKQAEEAIDMYNNRVCLGIEKAEEQQSGNLDLKKSKIVAKKKPPDPAVVKIQKRSLPNTPDYAQSFKPDDQDILYTRSKEGQKLRDFGYELITGDETSAIEAKSAKPWTSNKIVPVATGSTKKKSLNWMTITGQTNQDSKEQKETKDQSSPVSSTSILTSGSFRKTKIKLDNLKASSEKLFLFKSNESTKPSLTLPQNFNKKPANFNQTLDGVLHNQHQQQMNNLKKSSTFNAPDLFAQHPSKMRKNSAPSASSGVSGYFTKLNFSGSATKTVKEKKILGSPRLHRAIFGRNAASNKSIDHEVFAPVKAKPRSLEDSQSEKSSAPDVCALGTSRISPEYPNLECPPVFESEVYSLKLDAPGGTTLLKRRQINRSIDEA